MALVGVMGFLVRVVTVSFVTSFRRPDLFFILLLRFFVPNCPQLISLPIWRTLLGQHAWTNQVCTQNLLFTRETRESEVRGLFWTLFVLFLTIFCTISDYWDRISLFLVQK